MFKIGDYVEITRSGRLGQVTIQNDFAVLIRLENSPHDLYYLYSELKAPSPEKLHSFRLRTEGNNV